MQRTLLGTLIVGLVAFGGEDHQKEYAAKAASIEKEDAAAHYRLALWCKEKGLRMESIREMRVVVMLEPDHLAARRALGYEKVAGRWVSGKEKMRAKGFVKHDGVWLTPEEYKLYAADEVAAQQAREARKTGNAAVKMAWSKEAPERARAMGIIEGIDAKHRLRPLAIAARINYPDVRLRAVKNLGAMNSEEALPPLYKRAIFDRDETIRKAAVEAIRQTDAKGKIGPFVKALQSPFDSVRLHATQALGALGDAGAVGPLVARYQIAGGSGQLVYLTQVNQVSYVQDFDVEVAQTSFIADPVIGVVQDGLVHAFRVQAINGFYEVYEKPALAEALSALTGKDLGEDPKAWLEYYKQLKLAELREKKRRQHERVSGS
ncbi:MAG: HEAT repeat domain-containing protein [Planctomycetota bacterium]|jgi:hypothetical protein